ncbi:MAG: hypothetical protein J6Y80_05775 [Victivallales bacterium]|nr:hypothetical protein [Victivallales bacterium]
MTYQPLPFYFLNTTAEADFTQEEIDRALSRLRAAGYGGFVLFNKPPTGFNAEEYLSDWWFEVTRRFLVAARAQGLEVWLNDGFDFPPGDPGFRISRAHPELCQQRLTRLADGRIVPIVCEWGAPAFEEPLSSELFQKIVYEEYARRLGEFFGNPVAGFFSDADNRRFTAPTFSLMPGERYYPWSANFAATFLTRKGYDVVPCLEEVLAWMDTPAVRDYWEHAGFLYQQWFARNAEWCHAHGLKYTFHTSDTGPHAWANCLRSSAFTEGLPFALLEHSDLPGTDHELTALDGGTHYDLPGFDREPAALDGGARRRKRYFVPKVSWGSRDLSRWTPPDFPCTKYDLRAKLASSAAFVCHKERSLCELFAATNHEASPTTLRKIAAWQILCGINFLIPHAVHHRFFGEVKDFAPPEFLHGIFQAASPDFNDWLAQLCEAASIGVATPQVAVRLPTRKLWGNHYDPEPFFALCERLFRTGVQFVFVEDAVPAGLPVIEDAAQPGDLPSPVASYDGGDLLFLERLLPDGTRSLLAGNIWCESELSGAIRWNGREWPVALAPGEVAILGGPFENYRSLVVAQETALAGPFPVSWEQENRIPLWNVREWTNHSGLKSLKLLIPNTLHILSVDGVAPGAPQPARLFDDEYLAYDAPNAPGRHAFALDREPDAHTHVFLAGDFDAEITTVGDFARKYSEIYCMEMFVPAEASIVLSPRRAELMPSSWTEQGAPFYSGAVTYRIDPPAGARRLRVETEDVVELLLNGQVVAKRIWAPYDFALPERAAGDRLELRVTNTLANQQEAMLKPSGLLGVWFSGV